MVKSIKKRLLNSEAELMMKLDCDHIIKCYDIYENKELKIIVTDYFSGGTLTSKIQS
jgi:serine/threonine protein kinase